jgi:hypothetical protein
MNRFLSIRKSGKTLESLVIFNGTQGKYEVKHSGHIVFDKLKHESNSSLVNPNRKPVKSRSEKAIQSHSFLNNIIKEESKRENSDLTHNNNSNNILKLDNGIVINKYKSCSICDLYIEKSLTLSCLHNICDKCIKGYYENRIESGYTNLLCPIYICHSRVEIALIKEFISDVHFDRLTNNIVLHINIPSKSKVISKHLNLFKSYLKKNVLDVTDDNSYMIFNKFKDEFCERCREPALFGQMNGNSIKCLNCFAKYCKFCFRETSEDHFDRTANKYCKIFYRKKNAENHSSENFMKGFLLAFLTIAFSYFLVINNGYFQIYKILPGGNIIFKPFKLVFIFLLFIFWFFITIIIFPFFPIMLTILYS